MKELTMFEKEFGLVENKEGKVIVSSRVIAEKFDKRHSDVLEKIYGLIEQIQATEFSARYFLESEYIDLKGEKRKECLLTRDGFSLLVMGFTGQKALEWKLKYIDAFNEMEKELEHRRQQSEEVIVALSEKDEKVARQKLLKSYFGKRKTVKTFKFCTFLEFNGLLDMFNEYIEKLPAKQKQIEYSRFINGITQNRNSLNAKDKLYLPKTITYSHYIQEFTERKSASENKSYGKRLGHKERELEKYKQMVEKDTDTESEIEFTAEDVESKPFTINGENIVE